MKCFTIICALAAAMLLSGCVSDPWMKDVSVRLPTTSFDNQDEQIRIGYLARYLADADARARLESRVLETEYVRQWDAVDHSTFTSMSADLAVGQFGSAAGDALGASVLVLGMLSGDGSLKYISQAFMPDEFDGKPLRTSEEVRGALMTMMDRRLQSVAGALSAKLACFYGCESSNRIYRMVLGGQVLASRYPYLPEQFLVAVNIGEVEAVTSTDPISALVGFPVKWKTQQGNSASVRMFDKPALLTRGALEIARDSNGFVSPVGWRSMDHTTIGTQIIATLYASPQLIWGAQRGLPNRIFYNGHAYGFISNGRPEFVNKRLSVPLLPVTGPALDTKR